MDKKIQKVLDIIKENNIQMVDFKMVDINGQFRHVTIPANSFTPDIMRDGIGFDASNYGYARPRYCYDRPILQRSNTFNEW